MLPTNHIKEEPPSGEQLKRILVVEPSRINWIGLHQLLINVGLTGVNFCRVSDFTKAKKKIYEFKPDVVLFTSLSRRTDYLLFLSFLSGLASDHPKTSSVIWLQHDMAWLIQLFLTFGVGTVLIDPVSSDEVSQCLGGDWRDKLEKRPCLLGKQERLVALALLRGDSVTTIAKDTGKNIRTISAQKKSIIKKLEMKKNEELYLLAGRLIFFSKMNKNN